jgi:hypothetical protein
MRELNVGLYRSAIQLDLQEVKVEVNNSRKKSPSSVANRFSACLEIPRIL